MKMTKRAKALIRKDFDHFEGYFLNEALASSLYVANFDYSIDGMQRTKAAQTAVIAFTVEGLHTVLGTKKNWPDPADFVIESATGMALYVTETPMVGLVDRVPQFIVPDAWKFMRQVESYLRSQLDVPVVAITGSAGKTTAQKMLDDLLKEDYQVLSNRNDLTTCLDIDLPLYLTKLAQSPDLITLDVSPKDATIRGKEKAPAFVRPTIAVLTSIPCDYGTTTKDLAELTTLSTAIFNDLTEQGVAILNQDLPLDQRGLALSAAKEKTDHVLTYSMKDSRADLHLVSMKELKEVTEVTVSFRGELSTYYLSLSSMEIVESSLAVLLVLKTLGIDPAKIFHRFSTFDSLANVMERKRGYIDGKKVEIIDDTYHVEIPSMIHAITSFTRKADYYGGKKILALGQVSGLGDYSEELHKELLPYINRSGADLLLGYGENMRTVIHSATVPALWFKTMKTYLEGIREQLTEDSLILLKGSASASDYIRIRSLLDAIRTETRIEEAG